MSDSEEYRLAPADNDAVRPPAARPERHRKTAEFEKQRLWSLDAYRGLIMITLAFAGFGLAKTANNHLELQPDSALWTEVKYHFSHLEWGRPAEPAPAAESSISWFGCAYWDLIQPSFMFMVGVSMAFSYAKRRRLGHSYLRMLLHAFWRSLVLILLGIFLISNWRGATNWSLTNVLTQIGLGYTFLFLLWGRSFRAQAIAAVLLLLATGLAYHFYPDAGLNLETGAPLATDEEDVGVTPEWAQTHLQHIDKPWHKNANVGHFVDKVVLSQIPGNEFRYNGGGYQTINFIPSLVTMLFGLMIGELLRSNRTGGRKLLWLLLAGASGVAVGYGLDLTGWCPMVKRIWTPSWTLFSAGLCCWILASLFAVIDLLQFRSWAFPLRVVGLNSIAIYCMSQLLKPWTARTLETHLGDQIFNLKFKWGEEYLRLSFIDPSMDSLVKLYEPTIQAVMVGLVFWLICFWMYRNKFFIRI